MAKHLAGMVATFRAEGQSRCDRIEGFAHDSAAGRGRCGGLTAFPPDLMSFLLALI